MSATSIVLLALMSSLTGATVGLILGRHIGKQIGSDLQRVADIEELWRAMPGRDARGRFAKKET